MRAALLAISSAAVLSLGPGASLGAAQLCDPGWQPGFGWDPPAEASHAIVTAAPLGRDMIFVGGEFTRSVLGEPLSRIASYDGERWDDLQGGVNGVVRALVAWDPDGSGPQRELVVAAGDFTQAGLGAPGGPIRAHGVAAWDGSSWSQLAEGLTGEPGALVVADVNGDQVSDLIAATLDDGSETAVWQFDARAWQEIGRWPASERPRMLEPWDPDGPGPEPAWIATAADTTVRVWDGAQWEQMPPAPSRIAALAAFDPPGPIVSTLFITEERSTALYQLREHSWVRTVSLWSDTTPSVMRSLDLDGAGAEPPGLYFGTHKPFTFNGMVSYVTRFPELTARRYCIAWPWIYHDFIADLTAWRRRDERPAELWLARSTPDSPWHPGSVSALPNEPDRVGLGLGPFVALVDGVVSLADVPGHRLIGRQNSTLLRYDGEGWRIFATADSTIEAVVSENERRLYVGGRFDELNEEPMRGVALYEDGTWRQLGEGLLAVRALARGDLGEGERLYAASATVAGSPGISQWDGESWTTIGSADAGVEAIMVYGPDGPGGEPVELIVAGLFEFISGVETGNVAAFDGTSWRGLPSTFGRTAKLVAHDPDGEGPAPAVLHSRDYDGFIWRLAGGGWQPAGDPAERFSDVVSFDPDGSGPLLPLLLAAGGENEVAPARVVRLEEDRWIPLDGEFHSWCSDPFDCQEMTLSAVSLSREGGIVPALATTGSFLQAGDQASAGVAFWIGADACPCPADCDGSGELSFLDFLCFQDRFAAGDPAGDCDGDRAFTFFDFLCFQNAFVAGCD